jgi:hypothetical protein
MTSGHLGEWLAAQVFDIELEVTAAAAGIDGRFRSGPLPGRTVNIRQDWDWTGDIGARGRRGAGRAGRRYRLSSVRPHQPAAGG